MAIYLNVSHSLPVLFSAMSDRLSKEETGVFLPRRVVTQTEGINNWIRYKYAEQAGIAANLQFAKTSDIIYTIFRWLKPDAPPALDRSGMVWLVFQCLQEEAFITRFPEKAAYTSNDPVKQIALAMQMADLFDQYQVYRHDLITKWNKAAEKNELINDWQQYLWTAIKNKTSDRFIDRPQVSVQLSAALSDPENHAIIKQRMPQLHFFGIAIITPYYLELFRLLSSIIDIHFYLLNPCPDQPWMDSVTEKQIAFFRSGKKQNIPDDYLLKGNDLLLHWGKVLKESFYLLVEKDDFVNAYHVLEQTLPDSSPKSLLQKIKSDIYINASLESRQEIKEEDLLDRSVLINGCYTPVREVEVLYNFLIQRLGNQQDENPAGVKDILVLVSDIDAYAPIIHAIFKNGPVYLPYTIADESIVSGNTIFSALKEILEINTETFKSEEVLSLLESPYVKAHFGFKDIDAIREAVREAAIYFGSSFVVEDAERYRQSEAWMVGWEYGLKKMIYGLCMSGEPEYNDQVDTLHPLDTAEGAEMDQRIRLLHFFQVLREQLLARSEERTLTQWTDYLSGTMLAMVINPETEDEPDYPRFVSLIEEWKSLAEESEEKISFEVFRYAFFHHLEQEKRSRRFAGTGITFCSLVPMRSIPHRIVAMLGMDFNRFPRKEQQLSFNIITEKGKERVGDRNVRENDKHLFLETLLSAEETFYISYIARDQRDGSVLPPSSLIDQFIDYVARGIGEDADKLRKDWIKIHPLHGFSSQYDGVHYISYLNDAIYSSGLPGTGGQATEPVFDFSEINTRQLASFMENPPKVFLNKALNIYYHDEEALLAEHELFEMNKLQEWSVKSGLFDHLIYGQGIADQEAEKKHLQRLKQSGKIPLAGFGKIYYDIIREEVLTYESVFREMLGDKKQTSVELLLQVDDSVIVGQIKNLYEDRFIYVCDSSSFKKHLIRAWVPYLALVASGYNTTFYFIYKKKNELSVEKLDAGVLAAADALAELQKIIVYYRQGHFGWFYFHPDLAKDNLKYFQSDYNTFINWYEDEVESPYSYSFKDPYLAKAVENGFLDEENFETLRQNMFAFMMPLQTYFPALFK